MAVVLFRTIQFSKNRARPGSHLGRIAFPSDFHRFWGNLLRLLPPLLAVNLEFALPTGSLHASLGTLRRMPPCGGARLVLPDWRPSGELSNLTIAPRDCQRPQHAEWSAHFTPR